VPVGCTIVTLLSMLIARITSLARSTYTHENVTAAPASSVSNRKFRLMPSSALRFRVELNAVHAVLVQPTFALLFVKP
jgi:hypothetical protein